MVAYLRTNTTRRTLRLGLCNPAHLGPNRYLLGQVADRRPASRRPISYRAGSSIGCGRQHQAGRRGASFRALYLQASVPLRHITGRVSVLVIHTSCQLDIVG